MKSIQLLLVAAAIGGVGLTASAADSQTTISVRGRSGFETVTKAQPAKTTIALSKQGQGVGQETRQKAKPVRYEWRNASRPVS
jgi:hypothetical protein